MVLKDAQVQEMVDRQAIVDLISRLGLMLDQKSFDEAASVLAENVVVQTGGGVAEGLEEVISLAERSHRGATQHATTNILVDLDGDRACAEANQIATFWPDPRRPEGTFAIRERYRFEAIRTAQGWRLQRIEARPAWRSHVAESETHRDG